MPVSPGFKRVRESKGIPVDWRFAGKEQIIKWANDLKRWDNSDPATWRLAAYMFEHLYQQEQYAPRKDELEALDYTNMRKFLVNWLNTTIEEARNYLGEVMESSEVLINRAGFAGILRCHEITKTPYIMFTWQPVPEFTVNH
jgi:hypothetical protein